MAAMRLATWWTAAFVASASRVKRGLLKQSADFKLRLENFDSVQYSAAFSLGEQVLPVIYDTGSFEIIVLSTLCTSCSQVHRVYDSSKSTSFAEDRGVMAEHLFGSGPVRSERGYETVRLGGQGSPYAAAHTPFWQVVSHGIDVWDGTAHFSGIVGLGHPGQVPRDFRPEGAEAESMLSAMHIGSFAFCLERGLGAPGWLTVGPSVQALLHSGTSFQALRVTGEVHWGVKMTNLEIPGLAAANPCMPSCGAIVDSGTSLLAAPPSAAGAIGALAQLVRRDCSNLDALPVLRMRLDGKVVELPPAAYVVRTRTRVYQNSSVLRRMFSGSDYKTVNECSVGFMTLDKQSQFGPVWILGMPFLRYHYTVFDRASKTIHIAPSTSSCGIGSPPLNLFNANFSEGAIQNYSSGATGRSFTATDYGPTDVDLNAVRIAPSLITAEKQISL